jgi:hypothetical protein
MKWLAVSEITHLVSSVTTRSGPVVHGHVAVAVAVAVNVNDHVTSTSTTT